jgi:Secretion system C-terminal sorting domain
MIKKVRLLLLTSIFVLPAIVIINKPNQTEKLRLKYAEYIKNSPYSKTKILSESELKKIPKQDRPDLAFEQDFLQTMDPNTGRPERKRLLKILNTDTKKGVVFKTASTVNWETRGPLQVAGRTRALMFDPNDMTAKKVWAGAVSGGIWYNDDITDSLSVWQQSNQNMANFAITAMTYDPVNTQNFYVGTGEGYFNLDAVNGAGIWKSSNGGATWNHLSNTVQYEFVYDMVVRNESGTGVLYVIVRDLDSADGTEVMRSVDGGVTFTVASSEPFRDLEIAADNTLWAGDATGGVWKSTDGTTWTQVYTPGDAGLTINTPRRVEIATAPSDANTVWALITDGSALGAVVVTLDGGTSWIDAGEPSDTNDSTVPNTDFTRGQSWYDLIAAVSPTNNFGLYLGGVNSFKMDPNSLSYKKISTWHTSVDNSVSYAHADFHALVFRPGFNNELIMGTDGGVYYIPDVANVENVTDGIKSRNNGYVVTQFYSLAIEPNFANGFLGGTQDNGTHYFNSAGIDDTVDFSGGDGGFCFIDQTFTDVNGGLYFIVSNTGNSYYLHDFNTHNNFIPLIETNNGSFINAADYDDENNILYSYDSNSAGSNTTITKVVLAVDGGDQGTGAATTATRDDIILTDFGSTVSHIRVSPYNASNRQLFVGTRNSEVARIAPDKTVTMITPPTLVGSVSCIEVGASDDELLVTVSNYGVVSVFYTNDGGLNWTEKEGNLPDMPVRWAMFNPLDRNEVYLATEIGVWKTSDISATTPNWVKANTGMGNVRVDMLQYRASDNTMAAATHGRGLFTSTDLTLSVKNNVLALKNSDIRVYPTVSDGQINIFSRINADNTKLSVYDINGRLVFSKSVNLINGTEEAVNLSLNSGIYILSLKGGKMNASQKIIIK